MDTDNTQKQCKEGKKIMERLVKHIINECKKYHFELLGIDNDDETNQVLNFAIDSDFAKENGLNENLDRFDVVVREWDTDIYSVDMALIINLGSWNDATNETVDYSKKEPYKWLDCGIYYWLSLDNLKAVNKWLEED